MIIYILVIHSKFKGGTLIKRIISSLSHLAQTLHSLAKLKNKQVAKILMPCPFTGPKMFCAGPNFLSQPKNLTAFSASSKTFVPAQKPILLNANHLFVWHKMFVTGTKWSEIFGLAQKIWTGIKHFGTCKRTRHKNQHTQRKLLNFENWD